MAESHSHVKNNAWKYLSFVLMGIFVIGVIIPSASAATVREVISKVFVTNNAENPVPTIEQEKSKLYDLVENPITLQPGWGGSIYVNFGTEISSPLGTGTVIDVSDYRQVCTAVSTTNDGPTLTKVLVHMGKITDDYLLASADEITPNGAPVCFDVKGPQLLMNLVGDTNTGGVVVMYLMLKS